MANLAARLPQIYSLELQDLEVLRHNSADMGNGSTTSVLSDSLRFLAISEFILNKDISKFRSFLSESVALRARLFLEYDKGVSIDSSYVTMGTFKTLLSALAAGEKRLSIEFASLMGGRKKIELSGDRPFDLWFGYALKSCVLELPEAYDYIDKLDVACDTKENKNFAGYPSALRGLVDQDISSVQASLEQIILGHKKEVISGGDFSDVEDELICVWGLGITNLARMRGMPVSSSSDLIPEELLI